MLHFYLAGLLLIRDLTPASCRARPSLTSCSLFLLGRTLAAFFGRLGVMTSPDLQAFSLVYAPNGILTLCVPLGSILPPYTITPVSSLNFEAVISIITPWPSSRLQQPLFHTTVGFGLGQRINSPYWSYSSLSHQRSFTFIKTVILSFPILPPWLVLLLYHTAGAVALLLLFCGW